MAAGTTKLSNLINPEVMGDMIKGKIDAKLQMLQIAKIDRALVGRAGNTITIPAWDFIGAAVEVAEGEESPITQMSATETTFTIKKIMKAVELTDEAVLSGLGNPVATASEQLAKSVAVKIDDDIVAAISEESKGLVYNGAAKAICYESIVNTIDLLEEEVQAPKVMYIHPRQLTELRLDPMFTDRHNMSNTVETGIVGMIAGVGIKVSKKVKLDSAKAYFINPVVCLSGDAETEDETAAVTVFMKRDINLEVERKTTSRKTIPSIDEIYGVAVTNQSKVVKLKAKAPASAKAAVKSK